MKKILNNIALLMNNARISCLTFLYKLEVRRLGFLSRRPHRSFRLTRRRDYVRSFKLPGYWSFTGYVLSEIWKQKANFAWLLVIYSVLVGVFIGMASQSAYSELSDILKQASQEVFNGEFGQIGQAGLLMLSGMTGSLMGTPTELQQAYSVFFGLMAWMAVVWLLRESLAGRKRRFRDALYMSGAPIIPTILVALMLIVQVIPAALAVIAISSASSSGLLDGGAVAMLFAVAGLLLVSLSLYWMTSTLIALVVVTLPGMYPMRAMRVAGDMVVGRRMRLLYRWLWMVFIAAVAWALIVIPAILIDSWLKATFVLFVNLPVIPVVLLLVSSASVIFCGSYVYLLYRRVMDDDADPA